MPHRTGPTPSRRRIVAGAGVVGLAMTTLATRVLAQAMTPLGGQHSAAPTADGFVPYLNQNFLIWNNEVRLLLKLVEVNRFGRGLTPVKFPDPSPLVFRAFAATY